MKTITLNEAERRLVEFLAKARAKYDAGHGCVDRKQDSRRGSLEVAIQGIGGEVAFCKLFNLYPDTRIDNPLNPVDAILYNGDTVDVKTTPREDGPLYIIRTKKPNAVNWFALMCGEFPTYRYAGRIRSEDALQDSRLREVVPGRGPCYVVERKELEGGWCLVGA